MDRVAVAIGGTSFLVAGVGGGLLTWYWEQALFASKKRRTMFAVTMGGLSGIGTVYLLAKVGGLKLGTT